MGQLSQSRERPLSDGTHDPSQKQQSGNGERTDAVYAQGSVGWEPGKHQQFEDRFDLFRPEETCHAEYEADLNN
jgi:hypothetical protein